VPGERGRTAGTPACRVSGEEHLRGDTALFSCFSAGNRVSYYRDSATFGSGVRLKPSRRKYRARVAFSGKIRRALGVVEGSLVSGVVAEE